MNKIVTSILVVLLLLGLVMIYHGATSSAAVVNLWSDFKAFGAKVDQDDQARHVLEYGGESDKSDYETLVKELWSTSNRFDPVTNWGLIQTILSAVGLIAMARKGKSKSLYKQVERTD
ncbi:MAG: hypothetical protein EOM12_10785 [Verrucomicrobiae bacterium]|nr:hypothetical protein [Verrucomicrobiae bacterium]